MEYGVIGTSDQSDTKDGLEELCPVCGDKACLLFYTHYTLQFRTGSNQCYGSGSEPLAGSGSGCEKLVRIRSPKDPNTNFKW